MEVTLLPPLSKHTQIHTRNLAVYLNLTLLNDRSHTVTSCTKCWRLWHWFWEKNINKKWAGIIRKNLHTSHTTSRKSERTRANCIVYQHTVVCNSVSLCFFLVGPSPFSIDLSINTFLSQQNTSLCKKPSFKNFCSFILLQKVL